MADAADGGWEHSPEKRALDAGRANDRFRSWEDRMKQAVLLGLDINDPHILQQLLNAHHAAEHQGTHAAAGGALSAAAAHGGRGGSHQGAHAAAGGASSIAVAHGGRGGSASAFAAGESATNADKAGTLQCLQARGAALRADRAARGNSDGAAGGSGLYDGGAGGTKKKGAVGVKKDGDKKDAKPKAKDDGKNEAIKNGAAVLGVFVLVSLVGLRVLWHQEQATQQRGGDGDYSVLDSTLPHPTSVAGGKVQVGRMKPLLVPGLTSTYPDPPCVPQPKDGELVFQFFNRICDELELGFGTAPGGYHGEGAGQLPHVDWVGGGRGDARVYNAFGTAQATPGTDGPSFLLELLSFGTRNFFRTATQFNRALRQSDSGVTILLTTARKAALANPSDTSLVGAASTYIASTNHDMERPVSETPIGRILSQNSGGRGNSDGPAMVIVIEPSASFMELWKEEQPGDGSNDDSDDDDDDDDNDDDDDGGGGGASSKAVPVPPAPAAGAGAAAAPVPSGDVKVNPNEQVQAAKRKYEALKAAAEEAEQFEALKAAFARPIEGGKSNAEAIDVVDDDDPDDDPGSTPTPAPAPAAPAAPAAVKGKALRRSANDTGQWPIGSGLKRRRERPFLNREQTPSTQAAIF